MDEKSPPFRETDIAYAAGLFEGEGSVLNTNGRNSWGWQVAIGMTDREPLERMLVFGGSIRGPYSRGKAHWKPFYIWNINGYLNVEAIFKLFLPYLSPRRIKQFEKVLSSKPIRRMKMSPQLMVPHG